MGAGGESGARAAGGADTAFSGAGVEEAVGGDPGEGAAFLTF